MLRVRPGKYGPWTHRHVFRQNSRGNTREKGGTGGRGGGGPKEGRPMDLPVFVLPSHEYYEVLYTSFF